MTTTPTPTRYRSIHFDSARWHGFELRAGDIVISTPPKSGTTWTQMLCALLVFDGADLPAPLEQLSPWLDMLDRPVEEVHATLAAQAHRRIIKTHTPLDGLPLHDDVQYVVVGRDPRDVAISFDHHMDNLDIGRFLKLRSRVVDPDEPLVVPPMPPADPAARYRHFVAGDGTDGSLTLAVVLRHLDDAWSRRHEPNVHLVHYADLTRDPVGELRRLASALGIELSTERARELSAEATLDRMRERADEVAPSASLGLWKDTSRFIRTGGTGEWRALVTAADERAYAERVAALVGSDVARWVHDGSFAATVAASPAAPAEFSSPMPRGRVTRLEPTRIAPETFVVHDHHGEGTDPVSVSLNTMVIRAAEPVVVDTGMTENEERYLADVFSLVEPDDVRWVFISHDDVDHTGNVNALMAACPNATLVVDWFMTERMGASLEVPIDRWRWVQDGDDLDVGDRTLQLVRPPIFDSPTTRGLFDPTTGVYWSSDAFGTVMPTPVRSVAELELGPWLEGIHTLSQYVSPWLSLVDETRFQRTVDRIEALEPRTIVGCHTPVIGHTYVTDAIAATRIAPWATVAPQPDQAVLDAIRKTLDGA